MATPPAPIDFNPDALGRTLEWSKVLDTPAGKGRFQAVREMLRGFLQESARAPNKAKSFLSQKMITLVGPTGNVDKLPRELRRILGTSADDFAREVQTGYYFLTGKAPGGAANASFKSMLDLFAQEGMSPEDLKVLRKAGPKGLYKMGGPGRAISALTEAKRDPGVLRFIKWTANKWTGKVGIPKEPMPMKLAEAAAKFKPTEATISGLRKAGATGLGIGTRALRGVGLLTGLAVGGTAYQVASTIKQKRAEEQMAQEMALTGNIPEELGGPAVVGRVDDKPITAPQFLEMMRERENSMKLARFNAVAQESDLTRDVLSYLSGTGPGDPQTGSQRIRLGSARPPSVGRQPNQDDVMKQFNALLRSATSGTPGAQ